MQAAAFYRHQAAPTAPGAVTQVSISFGETVHSDFLRKAWQVVAQRHPILRSAFAKSIDGLLVRESEKGEPFWISLDWQSVDPNEIPARWNALLASDAKATFEPVAIPLVRFHEIRLPGGGSHCLFTAPSYLLDEFSITRILLDLLLTLGQSPLAPAGEPPQFLKPSGWSEFLSGASAPINLEPRFGDGSAVRATYSLDRAKTTAFSKFCHDHDLEESLVVRCLWSLVLRRFGATGNVMQVLFDARADSTEAGYFQNRIPVVQSWSGTTAEWLDEAQALSDRMAENIWIDPAETLRAAGFDFQPQDLPASFAWRGPSINNSIHTALPRWINFDAQLQQQPPAGIEFEARPGIRLEFSLGGPFSTDTAAKELLLRLGSLIASLPQFYEKPVNRVPVLLPEEVQTIRDWSSGPNTTCTAATPVQAFRDIAAKYPTAVAVRAGDYEMTYSELDTLSDSLAAQIAEAGFAGGWHTALVLGPSAWIAVAILGAWKSGNSCLAVDHTAPDDWVESTLASHDVAVVLCDSTSAPRIDPTQRRRIVLDQDAETTPPSDWKPVDNDPSGLAASTPGHIDGRPIALRALTHAMLVSAASEASRLMEFRPGDIFLVNSMPGGGAFFDEWLIPLLSGGTAHVADDNLLEPTTAPVTHLRLTSRQWANQAAAWERGATAPGEKLRCVAIEGGVPLANSMEVWRRQHMPPIRQIVFFSPAGLCGMGLAGPAKNNTPVLPLGKPTAEVEVLIVDQDGLELPAGYAGSVFMKFPGWKELPEASASRHGLDLGLTGWRNGNGDVYLESAGRNASGLPTFREKTAAQSFVEKAFDVHVGSSVFALSNESLPGAVCVKEWLLTRAGWIDESALPQVTASAPRPTAMAAASPSAGATPGKNGSHGWVPITELQHGSGGDLLVLIHGAGGSTEIYSELVQSIGSSRRIVGISARGAHNADACHPSVESAAAQYIAALLESERPSQFQLAGFGFGAAIALEMARQMQAAGRMLPRLYLIGATPPRVEQTNNWLSRLKKSFRRQPGPSRMEPDTATTETASRHEQAWRNYSIPPCTIPATIVLPSDLADSPAVDEWQELMTEAIFEVTRSPWPDMLGFPAAKRIASILNSNAQPDLF
jgi:pimeloyl-ACP methyl ester carboxylesterase